MLVEGQDGRWYDDAGGTGSQTYATQDEASKAMGGGGGGSPFGGGTGVGGIAGTFLMGFIAILMLGPTLVYAIAQFVWGFTMGWKKVGKVIQSLNMVWLGPLAVFTPLYFCSIALKKAENIGVDLNISDDTKVISLIALAIITPIWYFFWHYDVVKAMGAEVFCTKLKWAMAFIWIGFVVGYVSDLLGFFGLKMNLFLTIGGAIAGYIYYIATTLPYWSEVKRDGSFKFRWIGLAVAVVATVVVSMPIAIQGQKKAAERRAEASARATEIKADMPEYIWVDVKGIAIVHAKPNAKSKTIVALSSGYRFVPTAVQSSGSVIWYAVTFYGKKGWINADDITTERPENPGVTKTATVTHQYGTFLSNLPGGGGKVVTIAKPKKGETVTLMNNTAELLASLGYSEETFKSYIAVWYKGKVGWTNTSWGDLSELQEVEQEGGNLPAVRNTTTTTQTVQTVEPIIDLTDETEETEEAVEETEAETVIE